MRHGVRRGTVTVAMAGALAATAVIPATAAIEQFRGRDGTQAVLDEIVRDGTPGAVAQVIDGRQTWDGRAGVADRATGRPRGSEDRFRVASLTKPFTATVLLQLAGERRRGLSLDDTVDKWLPGLVRGNGNDGRTIKLRHLLNHTSGLFNYNEDEKYLAKFTGEAFLQHRFDGATPEELVRIALARKPYFTAGAPGEWHYSDTGYILAGMVIEKATGRSYEREVEDRIIAPLGLHATSLPGSRSRLPGPHGRHYSDLGTGKVYDVTEFNPTVAYAAGEVVSTTGDLNRFLRALLRGRLLKHGQQTAMFSTVPVKGGDGHGGPDDRYGLGIREFRLKCEPGRTVSVWGHGGMVPGSLSRIGATRDGGHVVSLNRNADWGAQALEDKVVEQEFC